MTSSFIRAVPLLGGLLLTFAAFAAPAAAITFSGASVMGVNAGGAGVGYAFGENSTGLIGNGGGQLANSAFIATGTLPAIPSFLNTAVTPDLAFSLASVGSYTFTLYRTDFGSSVRALNLFFDGAANPGISAYELFGSTSFSATGSANLVPLATNSLVTVTGSGTLAYDDGSDTVTLTALNFQNGMTVTGFTIGSQTLTTGGATTNLGVATFTLNVTADSVADAPEPTSIALLSAGLIIFGLIRRRYWAPSLP
jgi:hypothetical protein